MRSGEQAALSFWLYISSVRSCAATSVVALAVAAARGAFTFLFSFWLWLRCKSCGRKSNLSQNVLLLFRVYTIIPIIIPIIPIIPISPNWCSRRPTCTCVRTGATIAPPRYFSFFPPSPPFVSRRLSACLCLCLHASGHELQPAPFLHQRQQRFVVALVTAGGREGLRRSSKPTA